MAVTQNSYTGNGTTTNYSFTFPYLKQSEIKASLDATVTTAFSIPNATTVQFNTAPANGVKIKIYRETDSDSLAATFYAGSAIKSEDLNDNFTQNLYSTQEVTERYLSNLGGTMVGDLALGEDVVVKFEGATDNDYETTLTVIDPTADRTITLPNITGTIVTTGDTGTVATGMIANDAINGTKIADDSVDSEHIAADSLDSEHYAPGSVDTTALGTNSVTTVKITDLNVTTAKIANLAVGTNQIAADAINGGKIADDSIDSEHYVADSIDTEHYAPNSVDADALAHTSVTAGTYTATDLTVDAQGRITAASSGTIARSEIAADAIDGTKLADNAVDSEHYTDGSIDHVHLANDVIDGDNIQDDVINSEHYAAGSIDTEHIADLQITTAKIAADAIDGTKIADNAIGSEHVAANSIGDSEIATGALDNRYYTETESDARYFNISTGDTIKDGDTFPDNDTTIATTAAINDRIIDLVDDVGGFVPIANETSFPNTNPDVNNGTGTIVSIGSLAGNLTSNSSGVITIANGTVGNSTVTITGAANNTTYSAGYGMLLETTTTLNTYTFHRLSSKATEVTTVAGSISNVNTVAGSISNVNAVAGNASNINAVAADATDIGAVAGKATEIGRLGTADAVSDLNTLGTTAVVSDLDTLADISSNITTVAGISGNVTTVAGISSNVTTVAGVQANVTTVAGSISNVNTVATNISNVNDFSDKYRVASSAPTSSLDTGDLYFDTSANELRVYNGSAWQGGVTATGNLAGLGANTFTGHQSLGDDKKVQFGAGNDLQIYHDGSHSQIHDTGTGNLNISSSKVAIWNAAQGEAMGKFTENGAVELYYDNVKKLNTSSTGVVFQGNANVSDSSGYGGSADHFFSAGNSNDLMIYHHGSWGSSYINNSGSGALFIESQDLRFRKSDGNELYFQAVANGAVELYYDNSKKLQTSSGGVGFYGDLWTDDNNKIKLGTGNDLQIYHDSSNNASYIKEAGAGNLYIFSENLRIENADGSDSYIEANNGGAAELYWDGVKKLSTVANGVHIVGNAYHVDNEKSIYGGGDDLQIYHDGSNNYIDAAAAQTLFIRTSQLQILGAGGGETSAKFNDDGNVELYYDNSKKFETASQGVYIRASGDSGFWIDNETNAGKDIEFVADANKFKFNDDVSANFGTGDDLKIYHNGSHSYIKDAGTGNLIIASSQLQIINAAEDEMMARFDQDGAVELYYDGSKKFETTSTGIEVTGTVRDSKGDLRKIIFKQESSAYTLVAADAGKAIEIQGNITIPANIFGGGDAVTIINDSGSDLTISKGTSFTHLFNTATGDNSNSYTIAGRGMATIYFVNGTTAYLSGAGIS